MNITLEDMVPGNVINTYYLKADSEDALWNSLETAELAYKEYDLDDELNSCPEDTDFDDWAGPSGAFTWIPNIMLDIIGTMYRDVGELITNENGIGYFETEAVAGFHANIKASLTQEQEDSLPTVSTPTTPYRRWAGDV